MDNEKLKLVKIACHRNGVSGIGFWVVIFKRTDVYDMEQTMLGIKFDNEKEIYTAVFDLDLLAQRNIAFGENSWRGDKYDEAISKWIKVEEEKYK